MNFQNEYRFAVQTAERAERLLTKAYGVYAKSCFDLVTDCDISVEKFIIGEIERSFPSDRILCEETRPNTPLSGRVWTVDPIDGTCNFADGSPLFGIQLALTVDGEPVVSAMRFPAFGETFSARIGGGVFLNGERLPAPQEKSLSRSIVSFGDYSHRFPELAKRQHGAIGKLVQVLEKVRMFGSAALDFAFVACGRTSATVVPTDNIWDLAPGLLLAKEAGCSVCDLDGDRFFLGRCGVIAACGEGLKNELVKSLRG